jgi:hypothetical protein
MPARWPAQLPHAVLVFEALTLPHPRTGKVGGKATRRRLSVGQRQVIRPAAENQAQARGMGAAEVSPASLPARPARVVGCAECARALP